MIDYYQNIITEKSWKLLQDLREKINFILIGGWAVYLYTHALKSKDVDIIIDYPALNILQSLYPVNKNAHLRKYEVKKEGIDLDIYLPFYSVLVLPIEEVAKYKTKKEGFDVITPEMLLMMKQKAFSQRGMSVKGQKDKIDIISLAMSSFFDFHQYKKLLEKYHLGDFEKMLTDILSQTKEIKELGLNLHQFSKIKKEILEKLR